MTPHSKNRTTTAGVFGGLALLLTSVTAAGQQDFYCDVPGVAPIRAIPGAIFDIPVKFALNSHSNSLSFITKYMTCHEAGVNPRNVPESLGFDAVHGNYINPAIMARFQSYDSTFLFKGSQMVMIENDETSPPAVRDFWFTESGSDNAPIRIIGGIRFTPLDGTNAVGILIEQGEPILTLPVTYTGPKGNGETFERIRFTLRLISDSALIQTNTTCSINDNQQINVAFNTLRQDLLTTDANSAPIRQEKALSYRCPDTPGWSGKMNITLVSDSAPFSANYIKTTNKDIGVALLYQGKIVKPHGQFLVQFTNGGGGDNVAFVPVKNNVPYQDIATGDLTGSAALVLSLP